MSVEILFDDEKIATSLAAPRNDADMKTVATLSGRNRCFFYYVDYFLNELQTS